MQYCHQADAIIRLPGKLDRLAFQLLPEAVAMQRVKVTPPTIATSASPDAGAVRQVIPLRRGFPAHCRPLLRCSKLQQLAIVMHANRQWAHLSTFQDLVDLFMRQFQLLAGTRNSIGHHHGW